MILWELDLPVSGTLVISCEHGSEYSGSALKVLIRRVRTPCFHVPSNFKILMEWGPPRPILRVREPVIQVLRHVSTENGDADARQKYV